MEGRSGHEGVVILHGQVLPQGRQGARGEISVAERHCNPSACLCHRRAKHWSNDKKMNDWPLCKLPWFLNRPSQFPFAQGPQKLYSRSCQGEGAFLRSQERRREMKSVSGSQRR